MALLLRAEHLRVFFGVRTLFDIDHIEIHDGDRIGLVGDNGAGKSTLLAVLHGDRAPDTGSVFAFARSAMVHQFGPEEPPERLDAAVRARLRARETLHEGISGGERERLRVAQALSARAPLLYADEPTTNLDFEGIAEVERALTGHEGALVLVSHDRALLDAVCTTIWALEAETLRVFPGNYSAYEAQKARDTAYQQFTYDQYRAEQARLRAAIAGVKAQSEGVRKAPRRMGSSEARLHKRGGGTTAKKQLDKAAGALQSRLANMEVKDRPHDAGTIRMFMAERPRVVSAVAVRADHLRLTAGGRVLLEDASFVVPTGKRTVLSGPNGSGKTTLLHAISECESGITISPGVQMGWFRQETLDTLDGDKTLLDNVLRESVLPAHEARTLLARMGLTARDMDKPASILSGGERAKAALARLMAGSANLLLLDEPGNYLDLRAMAALEDMLCAYEGTLLLVSHDRRMINRVAQRLLLIESGALISAQGTLADWEARKNAPHAMDINISENILRMRMAALLARLSAPRAPKGFRREEAEAEYEALTQQWKALQEKGKQK